MSKFTKIAKFFLITFILFSAVSLFIFAFSFLEPDFSKGFLKNKEILFDGIYKYAFYTHIFTAPFALIIATILILFRLEKSIKLVSVHKLLGKMYVLLVLCLAAPSGLIMSFYAIGGLVSSISFFLLAVLWFYTTLKAYLKIKKGDIFQHKIFMQRSYILVLSALFLRFYGALALILNIGESETRYIWISWLCWLPNILIFELMQTRKIVK